ncbi:MAG TPA: Asp-tRNA(Asn)/Glu-tRNA(Gln) amidotransferase subunit GatC [Candidatus Paceibacterota bacterium]|jgi:aspartyl/glutamyl-tRNA(Asn/Gln) amidotransferase C subunit|nr:Asp-tRNA(Asn)/Glu-tRNA(Gln) amidotransferase subunit GatC [Candidatus Paceibacterota bacterium]
MSANASPEDVKKLAALARLHVTEAELPKLAAEFDSILAYIGQLDELSLSGGGGPRGTDIVNAFRADGTPHEKGAYTKALVDAFPKKEGDALSVKQIIVND